MFKSLSRGQTAACKRLTQKHVQHTLQLWKAETRVNCWDFTVILEEVTVFIQIVFSPTTRKERVLIIKSHNTQKYNLLLQAALAAVYLLPYLKFHGTNWNFKQLVIL